MKLLLVTARTHTVSLFDFINSVS